VLNPNFPWAPFFLRRVVVIIIFRTTSHFDSKVLREQSSAASFVRLSLPPRRFRLPLLVSEKKKKTFSAKTTKPVVGDSCTSKERRLSLVRDPILRAERESERDALFFQQTEKRFLRAHV